MSFINLLKEDFNNKNQCHEKDYFNNLLLLVQL